MMLSFPKLNNFIKYLQRKYKENDRIFIAMDDLPFQ